MDARAPLVRGHINDSMLMGTHGGMPALPKSDRLVPKLGQQAARVPQLAHRIPNGFHGLPLACHNSCVEQTHCPVHPALNDVGNPGFICEVMGSKTVPQSRCAWTGVLQSLAQSRRPQSSSQK